jgi:putative Mg2+ transporter-C (MgtC) family protein
MIEFAFHPISSLAFIGECILSVTLGALLGIEREYKNKPAGIKTHSLICLGATSITYLSIHFSPGGDPGRIAAQIISGIGFIGGGAILHSRNAIQGITTASTLWVAAALGMLVGAGLIIPAIAFAIVCLLILTFSYIGINKRRTRHSYAMSIEINNPDTLVTVEGLLRRYELSIDTKTLNRNTHLILEMSYRTTPLSHHLFLKHILDLPGIGTISSI